MKSTYIVVAWAIFALHFVQIVSPAFGLASGEKKHHASMPASLRYIAEEAFEGVAFESVTFENGLVSIAERAFAGADRLNAVYFPPSAESIADNAFSAAVVIHGVKDSYAQTWAERNGRKFVEEDIWNQKRMPESIQFESLLAAFWLVLPLDKKKLLRIRRWIRALTRSMRPQDRPELYPIQYRFP